MRKTLIVPLLSAALVSVLAPWGLANGLTADQILDQVEKKSFMGGAVGSTVAIVKFDVTAEGTTTSYTFKVFSVRGVEGKPDRTLIVYLAPDLVAGTMFLTWTPKEGKERMWLYLPALGIVKELISEEARKQEFVSGSGISREDIAKGFKYREDYQAKLIGEEEVKGMPCYVLVLTPKEGHETEWARIKLWVHKEEFVVVRSEFYNADGKLAKVMEGEDFHRDELGYIPHKIVFKDLINGNTSVLTIVKREKAEIPDDYFDPEKLPTLKIS